MTPPVRSAADNDYLADLIKHGGAPTGRPGMPAFGPTPSDEDIRLLVPYVRGISKRGKSPAR